MMNVLFVIYLEPHLQKKTGKAFTPSQFRLLLELD